MTYESNFQGEIHSTSLPEKQPVNCIIEQPDVPTPKKRYRPTGNHIGRPTKEEQAFRNQIKEESRRERMARAPKFGPPVPIGLGWGGARRGAGRPKGDGIPKKKIAMVRLDRALAEKLEALPPGQRSEYVRQALDLMKDIQPPEKFGLASGKETGQNGKSS
jgi:hypothetical protein